MLRRNGYESQGLSVLPSRLPERGSPEKDGNTVFSVYREGKEPVHYDGASCQLVLSVTYHLGEKESGVRDIRVQTLHSARLIAHIFGSDDADPSFKIDGDHIHSENFLTRTRTDSFRYRLIASGRLRPISPDQLRVGGI